MPSLQEEVKPVGTSWMLKFNIVLLRLHMVASEQAFATDNETIVDQHKNRKFYFGSNKLELLFSTLQVKQTPLQHNKRICPRKAKRKGKGKPRKLLLLVHTNLWVVPEGRKKLMQGWQMLPSDFNKGFQNFDSSDIRRHQ